ncbi:HTH_48 domain-containing protein [Trichonephila clavata]|uniref:HTH_48 domain-containing protein n=1 Tax=Trichonephila clavata TaxID=2740835 RepID=A0A8X6FUC0_TRICU|nr:HTH_48 domain-containing protein [Trichonephila clavata]
MFVGWMVVTPLEQRADIKIAVLRGKKGMEWYSKFVEALGNNALPYRTVARWVGKFQQERMSTSDEQRSGRSLSVRTDLARAIIKQLMDENRQSRQQTKTARETHNKRIVMSNLCVLCCHSFAP